MGGAVVILFFLPWLDHSPVKSIRYRPGWHKDVLGVFVVIFLVLGYLGSQPPSAAGNDVSQVGTLFYFGVLPADALVEPPGQVQAGARSRDLRRPLNRSSRTITTMKKLHRLPARRRSASSRGASAARRRHRSWDQLPDRQGDRHAALQNGAKLFVNYCLNCHSAAFMRYNRLRDIGLTEEQIKENLLFATDKVGETMKVGARPEAGQGVVRRRAARPDA